MIISGTLRSVIEYDYLFSSLGAFPVFLLQRHSLRQLLLLLLLLLTSLCSVQPRPLADNVTLPTSTTAPAIDRYVLPTGRSAANPPHAAVDPWDRETDGRSTFYLSGTGSPG